MSEIKGNRRIDVGEKAAKDMDLVSKASIGTSVMNLIRTTWNPQPLQVPKIDPTLEHMPVLERITEVLRYQLLQIEYALSSRGGLREWGRVVIVLSLVMAIPAVLLVPLVTLFLNAGASWAALLFLIAKYLLYTLLTVIATVVVALVAEQGFRAYWKWRMQQSAREAAAKK